MKRILLYLFTAVVLLGLPVRKACAQENDPAKLSYIKKYKGLAVQDMHRSGVPASITLAQGILESGSGMSPLAVKGNNHFGIKCHSGWKGKSMRHDDDAPGECFRVYSSVEESFRDHSDFLRYQDRYKFLFDLDPRDYKGWAYGLKKAGYATNPQYPQQLIRQIELYNLDRFDTGDAGGLPPSPHAVEAPKKYSRGAVGPSFEVSLSREMYSLNGVPFVYSIEGETYESIARDYDLFVREILSFNDLKAPEPLAPGTIVYVQAKKKDAAKGLEKYIVASDGESLRLISQRFGVKLSSILKKNGLPADYVTREGDELIIRGKRRK